MRPQWVLAPLCPDDLGPFADFPRLADSKKEHIWRQHRALQPGRVPVTLSTNNRVALLDARIAPQDFTYERVFNDPLHMLLAQLRWQYVCRMRYNVLCDGPTALPDCWEISVDVQNVYDAAQLGAPIHYHPHGIPETVPIYADDTRKNDIFAVDIEHPLENPFLRHGLALRDRMADLARQHTFLDRPIRILPYHHTCTDGPVTVGLNLRGPALLTDFRRNPAYVHRLFEFIVTMALKRRTAFEQLWKLAPSPEVWLADDSVALLSPTQFAEFVLPYHRLWYDSIDPQRERIRAIHLCGDATRHFSTLTNELGVTTFDTGFPVDFTGLRRELGPNITIFGGVEVPLLTEATPQTIYTRACEILRSGIVVPGRFILREANNLPPGVPWANLAAMYQAAFDCAP